MIRSIFYFILVVLPVLLQAKNQSLWTFGGYLGASNMLSDLGGANANGTNGIKDIDVRASRPVIGLSLFNHQGRLSYGLTLNATHLVGDDAFTSIESRARRNLSVRTDVVELAGLVKIHPFNHRTLAGIYLNGGVGALYYQPKARYNNEWVKLRPLGTEGQNHIAGSSPYSTIDIIIPFGAGYSFPLGRYNTLSVDLSLRKSFTDYLDDVSTTYTDNAVLAETSGEVAAALADRSTYGFEAGTQRGNPSYNDNYFLLGLRFERIIGAKKMSNCYFNDPNFNRKVKKHRRWTKMNL